MSKIQKREASPMVDPDAKGQAARQVGPIAPKISVPIRTTPLKALYIHPEGIFSRFEVP